MICPVRKLIFLFGVVLLLALALVAATMPSERPTGITEDGAQATYGGTLQEP